MARNELKWDKIDNTAHLFPVIAGEKLTNVYRISSYLNEEIIKESLQEALEITLKYFPGFKVELKSGFFWYYFEENTNIAPKVKNEKEFPCRYINERQNNRYMFRVSYYQKRINLEVFHILADGMGGINFMRELVCRYLSIVHKEINMEELAYFHENTSLNREDSFLKNYKKSTAKKYKTDRALLIKGDKLPTGELGIIHGFMSVKALKIAAKKYSCTINEYLVSIYVWSIYKNAMNYSNKNKPIRMAIPVNLRPFFESITTKNFFIVVSAEMRATKKEYTFEEVLKLIKESLEPKINKEHFEELLSYNVSNEKNIITKAVPLFIKNIAIRLVYHNIALANTSTMTNVGNITINKVFEKYIDTFIAFLSPSLGQPIKGTICSYKDKLCLTFSSSLIETYIQRDVFRKLSNDGLEIKIESNGVYYE